MQSIRESKLMGQVVLCTKGRHVKTFNLFLRIGFGCNNIDRCVNWPDGVTGLYWHNMTQCEEGRASDSVGNKMNILPCSTYWPLLPMFFREIKCIFFLSKRQYWKVVFFVSKGYVSVHVNCTLKLCIIQNSGATRIWMPIHEGSTNLYLTNASPMPIDPPIEKKKGLPWAYIRTRQNWLQFPEIKQMGVRK